MNSLPDPWAEVGTESTSPAPSPWKVGAVLAFSALFIVLLALALVAFLKGVGSVVEFLKPEPGGS